MQRTKTNQGGCPAFVAEPITFSRCVRASPPVQVNPRVQAIGNWAIGELGEEELRKHPHSSSSTGAAAPPAASKAAGASMQKHWLLIGLLWHCAPNTSDSKPKHSGGLTA